MLCNHSVVDGGWNNLVLGPCSKTCGGGIRGLTRECNKPKPSCNGKDCEGPNYFAYPIPCGNVCCPGKIMNIMTKIATYVSTYVAS